MRPIGMLLVLLFALRLQFAEGRWQVDASCAHIYIESVRLAGSLLALASTGGKGGGGEEMGKKRGQPATIASGHMCCPTLNCRGYGKFGSHPDHRIVGAGLYATIHNGCLQLFQCQWCGKRFSETQGTVFFGLKPPAETVYRALTALAEGVSIRSTARIFGEIQRGAVAATGWRAQPAGVGLPAENPALCIFRLVKIEGQTRIYEYEGTAK